MCIRQHVCRKGNNDDNSLYMPCFFQKHNIPISGIPCLHYRKEKEKEQQMENKEQIQSDNSEPVQEKENENQSVNGETNAAGDYQI